MKTVGQVRITSIKVKKDKFGTKWAKIKLLHLIQDSDDFTPEINLAIVHMRENQKVAQLRISQTVPSKNLIFWAAPGLEKPSETVKGIELGNFKIQREGDESHEFLAISFDFDMLLENARLWVLPSIGDDVMCCTEDAQLSLREED